MSLRIYFGLVSIVLMTIPYGSGQLENGGPIVSLDQYGYQALVHIIVQNQVVQICGGSIVSSFHVLSTASCFANTPNEYYDILVRVGSVNILKGGDVYNVSKVERHPEYDSFISTHNLAIIFITGGIQFMSSQQVQTTDLNYIKNVNEVSLGHQFIPGGDRVIISGYSRESLASSSNNLRDIYTYSMSYFPCLDYFRNSVLSVELIDDEILCVKNNPAARYCDILDGSPVIHDKKLIGIFLYSGGNCTDEKTPLLFTRIANNLLWLHSNINASRFKNTGNTCSAE